MGLTKVVGHSGWMAHSQTRWETRVCMAEMPEGLGGGEQPESDTTMSGNIGRNGFLVCITRDNHGWRWKGCHWSTMLGAIVHLDNMLGWGRQMVIINRLHQHVNLIYFQHGGRYCIVIFYYMFFYAWYIALSGMMEHFVLWFLNNGRQGGLDPSFMLKKKCSKRWSL